MMVDAKTWLYSRPALCVLLEKSNLLPMGFDNVPEGIFPVFPSKSTLSLDNMKISRTQIPLTPGFALTMYKVQGATFQNAVLDLHRKNEAIGRFEKHRRFCSMYVQLSRLQTLDGVQLLEPVDFVDISYKPHPALEKETKRLDQLSNHTLYDWTNRFHARRQFEIL